MHSYLDVYPKEGTAKRLGVVNINGTMTAFDIDRSGEKTTIEPYVPFRAAIEPEERKEKTLREIQLIRDKIIEAFVKAGGEEVANKNNRKISNIDYADSAGIHFSPKEGQTADELYKQINSVAQKIVDEETVKATSGISDKNVADAKAATAASDAFSNFIDKNRPDTFLIPKHGQPIDGLIAGTQRLLQESKILADMKIMHGTIVLQVPPGEDTQAFTSLKNSLLQGKQTSAPELAGPGAALPATEKKK